MKLIKSGCLEKKQFKIAGTAEVDILIGKKIKSFREIRRISQGALGEKVGVSYQQIQKYETGKNKLSVVKLLEVSRALDVHFSYFLDEISTINFEKYECFRISGRLDSVMESARNLQTMFVAIDKETDRQLALDLVYLLLSRQRG